MLNTDFVTCCAQILFSSLFFRLPMSIPTEVASSGLEPYHAQHQVAREITTCEFFRGVRTAVPLLLVILLGQSQRVSIACKLLA